MSGDSGEIGRSPDRGVARPVVALVASLPGPVPLEALEASPSRSGQVAVTAKVDRARARVAASLTAAGWHRAVRFAALPLALLLLPAAGLAYHVFFDRSGLPDIEPFLRFEPATIGQVYDARGTVLIELAREYRRVVSYDEVPPVLRHAILSAEDKNFFTHSGVDYRALPRVLQKTAARSLAAWGKGDAAFRLLFGQGGSTLTQQLVRGYFLRDRTSQEAGRQGGRRARRAPDLPRDRAPGLPRRAGGAGAAVPPGDRGRDRRVPRDAGRAGDGP
jgi:Transglycosylase